VPIDSTTAAARSRAPGARLLLGVAALMLLAAGCGASCPPKRGYGIVEFGGTSSSAALDSPDALGINVLVTWADLEPAEGVYDWSALDSALAAAHDKGKRVVPRVYTNSGDFEQATPSWVFDAGAQGYLFGPGSDTAQPVPTDPVFSEKWGTFLSALGARYNGNEDIEFFQTNAGMGGYGEMVWWYGDASPPPGWSPRVEIGTVTYWIRRWRDAFPDTALAIAINPIGNDIAETLSDVAVDNGFYLQTNTIDQSDEAVAIFSRHAPNTKIVAEIEDNGCGGATGAAFDETTNAILGYGFPIDYLSVCGLSFRDADRIHGALDRLRKDAVD
jgi:hypothetical protein